MEPLIKHPSRHTHAHHPPLHPPCPSACLAMSARMRFHSNRADFQPAPGLNECSSRARCQLVVAALAAQIGREVYLARPVP